MEILTFILGLMVTLVGVVLLREHKEGNRKIQQELRKKVSKVKKEEVTAVIEEIREETEGPTPEQDLADRLNQ